MKITPDAGVPTPSPVPPEDEEKGHLLVLFAVLFVFGFFGVLALWGVQAAAITAVAVAVVMVLPVLLRVVDRWAKKESAVDQ